VLRPLLHDKGLEVKAPFLTLDSVDAVGGYTGQLIIALASSQGRSSRAFWSPGCNENQAAKSVSSFIQAGSSRQSRRKLRNRLSP